MGLTGELVIAELEETYNFASQELSSAESLRVEHHLGYELTIRLDHGNLSEELFKIVRKIGSSCVVGVHCDEDTHGRVESHLLA